METTIVGLDRIWGFRVYGLRAEGCGLALLGVIPTGIEGIATDRHYGTFHLTEALY